jgi:GAF domain-containing protein
VRYAVNRNNDKRPHALLVVPVRTTNGVIGVLCADHAEVNKFSIHDQLLVETLAFYAGLAMERSIAIEHLNTLTNKIVMADTSSELLKELVDGACKFLNVFSGKIYKLGINNNIKDEIISSGNAIELHSKIKCRSIINKVLKNKETLIIEDTGQDKRASKSLQKYATSIVAIPIKLFDSIIGILTLMSKEKKIFSSNEILFLETLANNTTILLLKIEFEDIFIDDVYHEIREELCELMRYLNLIEDGNYEKNKIREFKKQIDSLGSKIDKSIYLDNYKDPINYKKEMFSICDEAEVISKNYTNFKLKKSPNNILINADKEKTKVFFKELIDFLYSFKKNDSLLSFDILQSNNSVIIKISCIGKQIPSTNLIFKKFFKPHIKIEKLNFLALSITFIIARIHNWSLKIDSSKLSKKNNYKNVITIIIPEY